MEKRFLRKMFLQRYLATVPKVRYSLYSDLILRYPDCCYVVYNNRHIFFTNTACYTVLLVVLVRIGTTFPPLIHLSVRINSSSPVSWIPLCLQLARARLLQATVKALQRAQLTPHLQQKSRLMTRLLTLGGVLHLFFLFISVETATISLTFCHIKTKSKDVGRTMYGHCALEDITKDSVHLFL